MSAYISKGLIGAGVDRVDGPLKVTGAAEYASDVTFPDLVHGVLVQSTIAAGAIRGIDTRVAKASAGVLAVITHANAPAIGELPVTEFGPAPPYPFRDNRIHHHDQIVAMVVAKTREQARRAARLVAIDYEETQATLGIENPHAEVLKNPWGLETRRGDVDSAIASAATKYDETFDIAAETNNPMGLLTTVARWDGERLLIHNATQWPVLERQILGAAFGIPEDHVRVLAPYVGGGFGVGLRVWPHVVLTALAARILGRAVKVELSRPQMFTLVGHRPESLQRLRLAADDEGRLLAIDHEATSTVSMDGSTIELITLGTGVMYACPNVATHDRQVRLNIPTPGWMRGPGAVTGNFAIESALDELAWKLRIDPIDLRLRNHADVHPSSGLPWSSKALKDCYRAGAERFGWSVRKTETGAMRDGNWLIGYGMASVNYEWYWRPCQARIAIGRDGIARVASAGTDIGTGTYTVMTQVAAELLGLDISRVRVELGDSDLPPAPQSGGSGLAISLGGAIENAAHNLLQSFVGIVADDRESPLRGVRIDDVVVTNGRIHLRRDPSVGEAYVEIMARHGRKEVGALGQAAPKLEGATMTPSPAFAAHFAEVRVDQDLGLVRVARVVSAVDGGRILNQKLARSQIIGAVTMGIGMTLLEETVLDATTGRVANATFADYLIPVNADIPDVEVMFVGGHDRFNALGIKGIGEIGTIGISAAIANAVFHATGRRIRSLPITIDKLL